MNPLISVIIPAYNRAPIISRAIESVLNQGFSDFELIVVDDGSSDNTSEVVGAYTSDSRINYYSQTNQGVTVARNQGASKACGKYLLFLDSDDELKTGYFNAIAFELSNNNDIDIFFAGVDLYEDQKFLRVIRSAFPYGKYSTEGLYLAGSFVFKKELFFVAGGYDAAITYGENTEFSIRLNPLLKRKKFLDASFLSVYQAKVTRTSNSMKNIITSTEYILAKHHDYYKANQYVKWLYHNIIGVGYVKTKRFEKAKDHFVMAIKAQPWRMKSYLRYGITVLPYLRKRVYGG